MTAALPHIRQTPTSNYSRSLIAHDLVVLHMMEGGYEGSVAWLCSPEAGASAHLCLKADGSEVTQLVPLQYKAWAQCAFNGRGVSIEIEGVTARGLSELTMRSAALLTAWICRAYGIPPVWAKEGKGRGVCCHHDLGAGGGGHVDICGVGDETWMKVMAFVREAYEDLGDGPLPAFALHGAPNPHQTDAPPPVAPQASHAGDARKEGGDLVSHPSASGYAEGSVADLQWRLNKAGANPPVQIDGQFGGETRDALARFQADHGCRLIDGRLGPESWAALARLAAG